MNIVVLSCRQTGHGLPGVGRSAVHGLLLRRSTVPGLLRRRGHQVPGVALLRHRRATGLVPVPERHTVQPGRVRVRLVVQRAVRPEQRAVPHQREAVPDDAAAGQASQGADQGAARPDISLITPHRPRTYQHHARTHDGRMKQLINTRRA